MIVTCKLKPPYHILSLGTPSQVPLHTAPCHKGCSGQPAQRVPSMQQLNQEDINAHPRAPLSLPASVVVQLYCQQFAGWLTNRKPDIQQFRHGSSYFIAKSAATVGFFHQEKVHIP